MRPMPLILAIILACSTVLAGVPLIATATDPQAGPVISPLQFDTEDVSESRCEASEEEREAEGVDAALDLFARPRVAVGLDMHRAGRTALDSPRASTGSCDSARCIRGPPVG